MYQKAAELIANPRNIKRVKIVDVPAMTPKRLAIHEAAHAAVALARGGRVGYATVKESKTALGHVKVFHVKYPRSKAHSDAIATALAGVTAERIAYRGGHAGPAPWRYLISDDVCEARKHAATKARRRHDREVVLQRQYVTTRRWLCAHWEAIQKLAFALMKRKRLTGKQIARLMSG